MCNYGVREAQSVHQDVYPVFAIFSHPFTHPSPPYPLPSTHHCNKEGGGGGITRGGCTYSCLSTLPTYHDRAIIHVYRPIHLSRSLHIHSHSHAWLYFWLHTCSYTLSSLTAHTHTHWWLTIMSYHYRTYVHARRSVQLYLWLNNNCLDEKYVHYVNILIVSKCPSQTPEMRFDIISLVDTIS